MIRAARYLAITAAALLLLEATLEVIGPDGDMVHGFGATGLAMMAALATIGTLLGRMPQGFTFALTAGMFGAISAAGRLAVHSSLVTTLLAAVGLISALVLIAVSVLMQRHLKDQPSEPPPHV